MSEHTKDLRVTLKAGSDYSAPWVTVDADDPDELTMKLNALLEGDALKLVVDTAQHLRAIHNALPVTHPDQGGSGAPAPQQPKRGGWGNSGGGQQQSTQQNGGTRYHPEGITCGSCGAPVQYKSVFSQAKNKSFNLWCCPNQHSRNDGHYSEFAD